MQIRYNLLQYEQIDLSGGDKMSEQDNQWAHVSEYKGYKSKGPGSNARRVRSNPKKHKLTTKNLVSILILALLVILVIGTIIFLWRGSWIIPFLQ